MRMSRVLLAGAAVAAAGIATSAFTAGNTVEDSVAGYGDSTVTGATTEQIDYVLNGADKSLVDEIRFELVEDFTAEVAGEGLVAWLTVTNAGTNVFAPVQCAFEPFAVTHPVSCDIPGTEIASFDGIALTVSE
ncbi:hypothetical protein SAMN05660748_4344 [Blastococcus aggregatus]|uniref:DUF11 domain-containing protein n=1 Tax=Blastococcus aggregatus TaxID=38502 RepID=A0A285VGV8_9ACTN|nr:hypothetical protein [Blastococcus aggregatus]SOC53223.1 hypothetical protein SAMN05660748_4344 [Blastococcus aggregatus]